MQFDEKAVPWSMFRTNIIGATDPSAAEKGSLRRTILEDWKALGLAFEPSTADNSVHASAGPVEGMRERMIWLGSAVEEDAFGKQMLDAGVTSATISSLMSNQVIAVGGKEVRNVMLTYADMHGPAFYVLEERWILSASLKSMLTYADVCRAQRLTCWRRWIRLLLSNLSSRSNNEKRAPPQSVTPPSPWGWKGV